MASDDLNARTRETSPWQTTSTAMLEITLRYFETRLIEMDGARDLLLAELARRAGERLDVCVLFGVAGSDADVARRAVEAGFGGSELR